MIVQPADGAIPFIAAHEGTIILWCKQGELEHGMAFDPLQATSVAIALLREAAQLRGDTWHAHDVDRFRIAGPFESDGDIHVRVVFEMEGAPIAGVMSLEKFSDMAADVSAMSRTIDASFRPRPDR